MLRSIFALLALTSQLFEVSAAESQAPHDAREGPLTARHALRSGPIVQKGPKGPYVSIVSLGAVGDGVTNNRAAIQAAFDYAAHHKVAAYIPPGNFAYSGTLTAAGTAVFGAGTSSVLIALNGAREALVLTGTGGSVSNLQMRGTGSTRLSDPDAEMIWAVNARNYTIQNVLIHGGGTGGIMSDNSHYGQILNNTVQNALADSITCIHGSSHIAISHNRISNSGDDGISVVSYTDAPIVSSITIVGNTVSNNLWGRGITAVGGNDIEIVGNHVEGGPAGTASVYVAAEAQWSTRGDNNVRVSGNTLVNGGGAPLGTGQGAITVYNSQGTAYALTNITLRHNKIVNPLNQALQFVGNGPEQVIAEDNTVYTDGTQLVSNGNPAAHVILRRNRILRRTVALDNSR